MKRIGLALTLSLVVVLTLLPASARAHRPHHTFAGCCVFITPRHSHIIHPRFIHPLAGSTVIVSDPAAQPVWVPAFWQWTGFQWVLVPGHWVFPGQRLLLRNPCD